jgi:hypothetical protein
MSTVYAVFNVGKDHKNLDRIYSTRSSAESYISDPKALPPVTNDTLIIEALSVMIRHIPSKLEGVELWDKLYNEAK